MTANTEEKDIKVAEADKEVSQKRGRGRSCSCGCSADIITKPSRRWFYTIYKHKKKTAPWGDSTVFR